MRKELQWRVSALSRFLVSLIDHGELFRDEPIGEPGESDVEIGLVSRDAGSHAGDGATADRRKLENWVMTELPVMIARSFL